MALTEDRVAVRDSLIHALGTDLIGPMADNEVISAKPSRWYLTGFLVPTGSPEELRVDPLADEVLESDEGADDTPDDVRAPRSFLPSSIGMSVLLSEETEQVEVTVTWGDYTMLDEAQTRQYYEAERDKRGVSGDAPDELRFRYWERLPTQKRTVAVPVVESGVVAIPNSGGVYVRTVIRSVRATGVPSGARAMSLFLVNGRAARAGDDDAADEAVLFHAQMTVRTKQSLLPRHRVTTTDHADDRRNDLQYRGYAEWAVGHGASTRAVSSDGECREIATTWLPTARVYRMRARSLAGVLTNMEQLARIQDAGVLDSGLRPLIEAYSGWIEDRRGDLSTLSEARQRAGTELMDQAQIALDRMRAGIELLKQDDSALHAFRLANRAMAAASRQARPGDPHWRLFQLAFLLLNLRGIAEPHHADRERVDLLFFPTGGGKTEAYLGVAAFALILRRLRGQGRPDAGAGVSVLLRYTLRLLTLDQLRRAAQLVCALELERREAPERLGSDRFSIGLWVGKSATANKVADVRKDLQRYRDGDGRVAAPIPLANCPWCDTPLERDSFELVPPTAHPKALTVGCPSLDCPFGFGMASLDEPHRDGLPIVVIDDQLYRELPSIVVGTVDKFASLPWRGAVGNLFGRVKARGEYGFIGRHEDAGAADGPLPEGLQPPDLIIQDELHLISGPLGTMVGLYESAIDAMCRASTGYGPKVIASTATARRSSEQIQAVFARAHTHLFPPQGIDAGDTFFAEEDRSPEKTRVYVGIAAPGRSAKELAARTTTTLLGAAQRQWKQAGPAGEHNAGDPYMTLVSYFNALKDLGGAQRLVQEDVSQRTPELESRRPLNRDKSTLFYKRNLSFDVLELTSRQSTGDVAKAIDLLSRPFGVGPRSRTDVLLASSMISVGVDIERLGLMLVNGQPRTTAEYIQASSRVGRRHPGLVVTAFNLYRPRDRSHYERFQAYHQSFYREVEAASVTPFSARAVDRGLAGLVVGLMRHLGPNMAGSKAVNRVTRSDAQSMDEVIVELLVNRATGHRRMMGEATLERLRERIRFLLSQWRHLVEKANHDAIPIKYSGWENPKKFTSLLSTPVDSEYSALADELKHFTAPTSMRDVEPSVDIWVDLPFKEGRA